MSDEDDERGDLSSKPSDVRREAGENWENETPAAAPQSSESPQQATKPQKVIADIHSGMVLVAPIATSPQQLAEDGTHGEDAPEDDEPRSGARGLSDDDDTGLT